MQDDVVELSHRELSKVTGGFLPLLGLIGAGSGIAGKIMDGIGKKKAKQAEELNAQNEQRLAAQQQQQPQGDAQPAASALPTVPMIALPTA